MHSGWQIKVFRWLLMRSIEVTTIGEIIVLCCIYCRQTKAGKYILSAHLEHISFPSRCVSANKPNVLREPVKRAGFSCHVFFHQRQMPRVLSPRLPFPQMQSDDFALRKKKTFSLRWFCDLSLVYLFLANWNKISWYFSLAIKLQFPKMKSSA